ncbi:hypothetical protein OUZ56_022100 [Daphnia magna]|uniref:Uncharacterized protein n=1 Tax=Daphnia magna TaxID=35525 RepID=A0ABR0AVA9_9CRUS|nr:hypothetical protein OUZ56_022100 [Daphnia magna]
MATNKKRSFLQTCVAFYCSEITVQRISYEHADRNFLQDTGRLQVSKHFDDMFRHWRRSGQMITGDLESVFVSEPIDSKDNAVRRGVQVRSFRNSANIFRLKSYLLLLAALGDFGSISTIKAFELLRTIEP